MFLVKNYTPTPRIALESFMKEAEKFLQDPFSREQAPKYPLTNIGYCGKNLVFELALAGFKKENIKVSYVGNVITVQAVWNPTETHGCENACSPNVTNCCTCCTDEIQYIQKNISNKDVCRKFYLANEYLGSTIKWKFVNGLLTVAVYPNEDTTVVDPSGDDEDITSTECTCNCCCAQQGTSGSEGTQQGTSGSDGTQQGGDTQSGTSGS